MDTVTLFSRHTRAVEYMNFTTCLSQTKSQHGVREVGTKPHPELRNSGHGTAARVERVLFL